MSPSCKYNIFFKSKINLNKVELTLLFLRRFCLEVSFDEFLAIAHFFLGRQ